tara:strand:- start:19755 stop:20681 length:927 start_codon:yes stop_codon:yes gene_type:complete
MRDQFIKTLSDLARNDPRIILITGDLGFGVFDDYISKFPKQFINAGVSEQNMTLLATGMALEGYITFTYSIANFPTLRCLEMIRNDSAYHNANVKIISIGGGFSYGSLGISHHATEDLSIMRSIPNITCLSPSSLWEVAEATKAIVDIPGTCYLRLDKDQGFNQSDDKFILGRPRLIKEGNDIAFFVTGGILSEVIKSVDILESEHELSCSVFSVHTIKPMNADLIINEARKHKLLVSVEENTIIGGLGSLILETLSDNNIYSRKLLRIGLEGCFSSVVGSQKYLRTIYHMDSENIISKTLSSYDEVR